jgi:ketosteroid isomerase-like protein
LTDADNFTKMFLPRHNQAHARFVQGDPEDWMALWSRTDPVSVFGGFGYVSQGWPDVSATLRKASARLSGGTSYRLDLAVARVSGDTAYTVGIEHSTLSMDGAPPADTALRVTQIYRRENGDWKIIHRHGDIIRPDLS